MLYSGSVEGAALANMQKGARRSESASRWCEAEIMLRWLFRGL